MSATDDLATVIELACLTEDRNPGEQRALLAVALRVDSDRGAFLSTNPNPMPPTLVAHARATYDPSIGTPVDLTTQQRGLYDRLLARWMTCPSCDAEQGRHWADGVCPRALPGLADGPAECGGPS